MSSLNWKWLLPLLAVPVALAQAPPAFSDPLAGDDTEGTVVTFGSIPRRVASCAPLSFTWDLDPVPESNVFINLGFTNDGVDQVTGSRTQVDNPAQVLVSGVVGATRITDRAFIWRNVTIAQPGHYLLTAFATGAEPILPGTFEVFVQDVSCVVAASGATLVPTSAPTDVVAAPSASAEPISTSSSGGGNNTASVVGGVIGAVILAALVASLLYYRRRKTVHTRVLPTLSSLKSAGQRKWGALASNDKRTAHAQPPSSDVSTPQFGVRFARTRTNSLGRTLEEEAHEKKSPTSADPLDYMPELSPSTNQQYANFGYNSSPERSGGLAAFTKSRARAGSIVAANPSQADDPFADSHRARGRRASTLSVPSTAHPSPRVSEILVSSSPVPSSAGGAPSIARLSSAMAKPVRKPVPQYEDASIEMTSTQTSPSPVPSVTSLSNSHTSSHPATSYESGPNWLHDRAPVPSRHIGLAGQGDGPVHYLMPDPPPPSRG